jgi:hypothetical protein
MDTTIRLAGPFAVGLVVFWLGRLHQRRAAGDTGVSRYRLWRWWFIAALVVVTAVGAGILEDRRLSAERKADRAAHAAELAADRAYSADLHRVSVGQLSKAEALAKTIPPGCPRMIDHKPWAERVEVWRTETALRIGEKKRELGDAFAADKGAYPHACRIEWVRNRLDYFMDSLKTLALVTAGR